MPPIDVTDATFATEVIERSRTTPVVVDFWAAWCGPCRALTPILEAVASRHEGEVVLAKLDTDANPETARAYRIQGIPAVKSFRDGGVVDEFTGLQPPIAVERFFGRLIPSEADGLVGAGDEESLRRALELEPGRADAALPLARLLLGRGDRDGALEALERVQSSYQAGGLAARIRLEQAAEQDPSLAPLRDALAALDRGDAQAGLDVMLDYLPSADGHRDDIRQLVVGELDRLGPGDPLAAQSRRRLAATLY